MRVAVIGAGIMGSSAAWALSSRGHEVVAYDQFPLGHDRGSSHGRTRIVRRAYPDRFWTRVMTEAYPLWADVERASGQKLVDECGLMYFGDGGSERVRAMVAALEENDVPHQVLPRPEAEAALPGLVLGDDEVGVLTPEAGVVRADLALQAIQHLALEAGARFETLRVTPSELEPRFDAVVMCAGPWIPGWVELPGVAVTMQTFGYANLTVSGPVWIDDTTLAYGFPSDEWGMKLGAHDPGPTIDPDGDRPENPVHREQVISTLAHRFGSPEVEVSRWTTCLYTSFADEQFRMGRLGERTFFASACSGHGFKLGPWVGRTLADVVEGAPIPKAFRV